MMKTGLRALLFSLLTLLSGQSLLAQMVQGDHVDTELVAETLAAYPGQELWVALRMDHQPGWHSYWKNPGDAGQPTEIYWDLPEGVSAGDIVWPTPERFDLPADLVDFGYTGEIFLLVPLQIADSFSADTLQLDASARWLECEEICIPASAELALSLPVQDSGPVDTDPRWREGFAGTRAEQPRSDVDIDAMFTVADGRIILLVQATEPLFGNIRDVEFIPAQHRVFDYLDRPELSYQISSLQLSQNHHSRLASSIPERIEGLLLVTERSGQQQAYDISARPEGVDFSVLGGELPLFGNSAVPLGLGTVFLFAMLGGLILNLMPCVFPVLSLKVISLVEGSHSSRREQQLHALVYTAGVILAFLLLATVLLLLQAGGTAVGWGFHLQSPWFVAALVYLFLFMGLSLSGVLELGTRMMGIGSDLSLQAGYRGSFFTGVLASVVASPCTAPFMGAALGFAFTQSVPVALTVFAALGLGMALPFLLISFVPALARLMPKPGKWMLTFKQIMAVPLYGTVLWLLWVLSRQVEGRGVLAVVASAALLAAIAWWNHRQRLVSGQSSRPVKAAMALAMVLALGVLISPWLQTRSGAAVEPGDGYAEVYSDARLAALRAEGQPVFVNMTASWCITCLVNERVALSSDTVLDAMTGSGVVYLKGDWTNNDPEITAVLRRYNTSGVPLYLMYPADASQPARVLPQILTEGIILDAIEGAI